MKYSLKLKTQHFHLSAGVFVAVMHEDDVHDLGIHALDKVEIINPGVKRTATAIVNITHEEIRKGNIGLFEELRLQLLIKKPTVVEVRPIPPLESISFIRKKIRGEKLSAQEIKQIVDDINEGKLAELEISALMTAVQIRGFDIEESASMARALISNGKKVEFAKKPILDKHCIGGINGRTSLVLVPIIAAAGYCIPKTASRAITSCAGTADAMDCLAKAGLGLKEFKKVVEKTNGCIAWGGSLDLAPVDDKIIKIEYPLKLDPKGQVTASVMAKKASVGAQFVVLDLPVGPEVKVTSADQIKDYTERFSQVGKMLGINVKVIPTDGTMPYGPAFGPALEARHALQILEGKRFDNLAEKSVMLAGELMAMTEKSTVQQCTAKAKEILKSGKALEKMREIIVAQGGKKITSEQVQVGKLKRQIFAKQDGKIKKLNVQLFTVIARETGAPSDKGAGVLLNVVPGQQVKNGDLLFEIFAENERKLVEALNLAERMNAVEFEPLK
ncbi:MAG: thymidine phosphorylase [Candidatus Diapherotrites archaeon]|nr:thymidine phosphorylase [Candidatus Diapherotrites archaeon]